MNISEQLKEILEDMNGNLSVRILDSIFGEDKCTALMDSEIKELENKSHENVNLNSKTIKTFSHENSNDGCSHSRKDIVSADPEQDNNNVTLKPEMQESTKRKTPSTCIQMIKKRKNDLCDNQLTLQNQHSKSDTILLSSNNILTSNCIKEIEEENNCFSEKYPENKSFVCGKSGNDSIPVKQRSEMKSSESDLYSGSINVLNVHNDVTDLINNTISTIMNDIEEENTLQVCIDNDSTVCSAASQNTYLYSPMLNPSVVQNLFKGIIDSNPICDAMSPLNEETVDSQETYTNELGITAQTSVANVVSSKIANDAAYVVENNTVLSPNSTCGDQYELDDDVNDNSQNANISTVFCGENQKYSLEPHLKPLVKIENLDLKRLNHLMKKHSLTVCWVPKIVHYVLLNKKVSATLKNSMNNYVAIFKDGKRFAKNKTKSENGASYKKKKFVHSSRDNAKSKEIRSNVYDVKDTKSYFKTPTVNSSGSSLLVSERKIDYLKINSHEKKHVHVRGVKNYTYIRCDYKKECGNDLVSFRNPNRLQEQNKKENVSSKNYEIKGLQQKEEYYRMKNETLRFGGLSQSYKESQDSSTSLLSKVQKPVSFTHFIEQDKKQEDGSTSRSRNESHYKRTEEINYENVLQQQMKETALVNDKPNSSFGVSSNQKKKNNLQTKSKKKNSNVFISPDNDIDVLLIKKLIDRRKIRNVPLADTNFGTTTGSKCAAENDLKSVFYQGREQHSFPSTSSVTSAQDMDFRPVSSENQSDYQIMENLIFRRKDPQFISNGHSSIIDFNTPAEMNSGSNKTGFQSIKENKGLHSNMDIRANMAASTESQIRSVLSSIEPEQTLEPVTSASFLPVLNQDNLNKKTIDNCFKEHTTKGNISSLMGVVPKNRMFVQEARKELYQQPQDCGTMESSPEELGDNWFQLGDDWFQSVERDFEYIHEISDDSSSSSGSPAANTTFGLNETFSSDAIAERNKVRVEKERNVGNRSHSEAVFDDLLDFKGFDNTSCKCSGNLQYILNCFKCSEEQELKKLSVLKGIINTEEKKKMRLLPSSQLSKWINNRDRSCIAISKSSVFTVACVRTHSISALNVFFPSDSFFNQQVTYCSSKDMIDKKRTSANIILTADRNHKSTVSKVLWRLPRQREERRAYKKKLSFNFLPSLEIKPCEDFLDTSSDVSIEDIEEDQRRSDLDPGRDLDSTEKK